MASWELAARPAALELVAGQTAVLVVDMQNDFGSEGGMFDRAGIDISPIRAIVPAIAKVLAAARRAGIPVVYLKMQYGADLSEMGSARAPNFIKHDRLGVGTAVTAPDGSESRILVENTWNTAIVDALSPLPRELVVPKTRYSGFFRTGLDDALKAMGVDTLIVTGATTSVCVDSTVRDAMFCDYRCVVLADCVAEPLADSAPRSNHEASLLAFEVAFGWVSESGTLLAALGETAAGTKAA